jgi:hypothetical protein
MNIEISDNLTDDSFYYIIKDLFENRKIQAYYNDSADKYGNPSITAKLAVIKSILCN